MKQNQPLDDLEISGEYEVDLPRAVLWQYLNNPHFLQQCIKGCDRVERVAQDQFCVEFKIKFGPLKKTFMADLHVINHNPPDQYRLQCTMDGGFAGKVAGESDVELTQLSQNKTRLGYQATVQVEGWIGELGVLVLGNAAKRYMQRFFDEFINVVENYSEKEI